MRPVERSEAKQAVWDLSEAFVSSAENKKRLFLLKAPRNSPLKESHVQLILDSGNCVLELEPLCPGVGLTFWDLLHHSYNIIGNALFKEVFPSHKGSCVSTFKVNPV